VTVTNRNDGGYPEAGCLFNPELEAVILNKDAIGSRENVPGWLRFAPQEMLLVSSLLRLRKLFG
jgi:hypothetical protein